VGPSPPTVEAAIVSNAATHTIFIASNGGGILKSTDDGASFVTVNNGLDEVTIATMVMDPTNTPPEFPWILRIIQFTWRPLKAARACGKARISALTQVLQLRCPEPVRESQVWGPHIGLPCALFDEAFA